MRENDRIRSIGILSYKIDSPRYTGRRSGYGNIIKSGRQHSYNNSSSLCI